MDWMDNRIMNMHMDNVNAGLQEQFKDLFLDSGHLEIEGVCRNICLSHVTDMEQA
jgi:hypothetical protein